MTSRHCDFCNDSECVAMFANPEMYSQITDPQSGETTARARFEEGHFGACAICAQLVIAGSIAKLADRAMLLTAARAMPEDIAPLFRAELVRLYSQLSRTAESFVPPEEYEAWRKGAA